MTAENGQRHRSALVERRYRNSAVPNCKRYYKGRPLKRRYVPNFICYDKIVVELKAVSNLTDEHRAQVQNQLRATGHRLGLLVNFGHYPGVDYEQIAL